MVLNNSIEFVRTAALFDLEQFTACVMTRRTESSLRGLEYAVKKCLMTTACYRLQYRVHKTDLPLSEYSGDLRVAFSQAGHIVSAKSPAVMK